MTDLSSARWLLDQIDIPVEGIHLPKLIREIEDDLMLQAYRRAQGNITAAAQLLGMKRTTLFTRLTKRRLIEANLGCKSLDFDKSP